MEMDRVEHETEGQWGVPGKNWLDRVDLIKVLIYSWDRWIFIRNKTSPYSLNIILTNKYTHANSSHSTNLLQILQFALHSRTPLYLNVMSSNPAPSSWLGHALQFTAAEYAQPTAPRKANNGHKRQMNGLLRCMAIQTIHSIAMELASSSSACLSSAYNKLIGKLVSFKLRIRLTHFRVFSVTNNEPFLASHSTGFCPFPGCCRVLPPDGSRAEPNDTVLNRLYVGRPMRGITQLNFNWPGPTLSLRIAHRSGQTIGVS